MVHVGQHRRLEEGADSGRLSAGGHPRTRGDRLVDMAGHQVALGFGGHRAHVESVPAIVLTLTEGRHLGGEFRDELVVHRRLDVDPLDADAGLARVENAAHRARQSRRGRRRRPEERGGEQATRHSPFGGRRRAGPHASMLARAASGCHPGAEMRAGGNDDRSGGHRRQPGHHGRERFEHRGRHRQVADPELVAPGDDERRDLVDVPGEHVR